MDAAATSEIAVAELLPALDAGEPLLLLDVRNAHDFAAWRLAARRPVETLHVPYFTILEDPADVLAQLPRERTIVAVCARGGSSAMVVELLRDAGFTARNLAGGMAAYGDHLVPVQVSLDDADAARFAIWQIQRRGRGCLSYVIRAGADAVVVDPSRHVARYEEIVAGLGARIACVVDTHVHADHLSGGVELGRRNDAPYFVGAAAGSALARRVDVVLPSDGRIRIGAAADASVVLRIFSTPGHTPESHAVLVGERHLLSGDTLLARGVGRPDLGEHALEWGRELHRTLHERLAQLGDATLVLPAHAASCDEARADGTIARTLGELRAEPELRIASRDSFARRLAAAVTPPPPSYRDIVATNLDPRPVDDDLAAEWETGPNHCAAAAA